LPGLLKLLYTGRPVQLNPIFTSLGSIQTILHKYTPPSLARYSIN